MVTSGEREAGRGKIRAGDEEVQTFRYKISYKEGYIVPHGECSKYFIITINGQQPLKIVNLFIVHL